MGSRYSSQQRGRFVRTGGCGRWQGCGATEFVNHPIVKRRLKIVGVPCVSVPVSPVLRR